MELIVYWTQFAEDKLEDIYHYYSEKASKKVALKLVNEIVDSTIDLQKNPLAGQEEEILKKRPGVSGIWFLGITKLFIGLINRASALRWFMYLIVGGVQKP